MLDLHAGRFVRAGLHFHAFSERAAHKLPSHTPRGDGSAAHLELPGAIGLLRPCPDVVFAEAVDLGLEAVRQTETHASRSQRGTPLRPGSVVRRRLMVSASTLSRLPSE